MKNEEIVSLLETLISTCANRETAQFIENTAERLRKLSHENQKLQEHVFALTEKLGKTEAGLDAERKRLDFCLRKAISLYHGQLTWTDETLRTYFVADGKDDPRELIDELMAEHDDE